MVKFITTQWRIQSNGSVASVARICIENGHLVPGIVSFDEKHRKYGSATF